MAAVSRATVRNIITSLKKHRLRVVLLLVSAGLFAYAGIGFWDRYRATHSKDGAPNPTQVVTHSTDRPHETTAAVDSDYTVPADQPRSIHLPDIKAEGLIQRVGLDQHNAPAVPTNVSVAGWYIHSAKPGEPGVSLIDGHVQGKYQQGVFKQLSQSKAGQRFTVMYGDKSERTFTIRSVHTYDTSEAAKAMLEPVKGVTAQLNLITCGGKYDRATGQYEKRIIVVAEAL